MRGEEAKRPGGYSVDWFPDQRRDTSLAEGEIHIECAHGCVVEFRVPQIVAIDPGHDGWVVGREPVVLIEFDFEGETISKLGMPAEHRY